MDKIKTYQYVISFYDRDMFTAKMVLYADSKEIASAQASRIAQAIECDSWAFDENPQDYAV